jgi:hypothetical protein
MTTEGVSPDTGNDVGWEVCSRRGGRPHKRRASTRARARARDGGQPEPALDTTHDQASFMPVYDLATPAPCILDWS